MERNGTNHDRKLPSTDAMIQTTQQFRTALGQRSIRGAAALMPAAKQCGRQDQHRSVAFKVKGCHPIGDDIPYHPSIGYEYTYHIYQPISPMGYCTQSMGYAISRCNIPYLWPMTHD